MDVLLGIKVTYFDYEDDTLGKMDGGWFGHLPVLIAFQLHSK